jgi:hypothetical protein
MNNTSKLSSLLLAGILTSSLTAQAAIVTVDGWTVNDDSFTDDAAGTYSEVSPFNASSGDADNGHWNDTSRFTFGGGSATWTFLGLENGEYEVAASWSYAANRAPDAFYTVQGGSAIVVNQRAEATGGPLLTDALDQEISFQMLTISALVTDGTLTVTINDGPGGSTVDAVADAIAIQAIPEPGSYALLAGLTGLVFVMLRHRR